MQALRASPSSSVAQSGTTFRAVPQLLGPCVARSRVRLSSGASPCHAAPCARASKSLRAQAVSQQLGPADVESSPAAAPLVHAAERSRAARTEKAGYSDCIMIQVFGWQSCTDKAGWYNVVKSKVADLQAAGFTHAWLPPPSNSPVSAQGYMPGQLYNLNSNYGNQQQLIELNRALREAGIAPIADIVINHRTASSQSPDGTWNRFGDDVDHEGRKIDWDQWAITSNDPLFKGTGNPDTGEDYGPAPDLDHANPLLREGLKNWLQWLHNKIGFDGWRLDFVKGYAAKYVTEYIESSVGLESVNVGEYWTDLQWNGGELEYNQDAARQKLCDWIDANGKSCAAFDFPTKGILQEAVKHVQYWRLKDAQGKAPGLIGWWPQRAVTFVDNHDTGSTQQHWPFPNKGVGVGYAYILTHPGIPCVFWEHMFDWGAEMRNSIEALIDARRRNGICADSKLEILCAEADMYVARIGGRLAVKLGPRYDMGAHLPKKEEGWTLAASGKDYAVWEKAA